PKGPGMKETVVDSPVNREFPGRRQTLPLGSYVTVADNPALRAAGSFAVTAWIAMTRHDPLAPGGRAADGDQGIVTKWSAVDRSGFGLFVDNDGHLSVRLGAADGHVEIVRAPTPLRPWVPSTPGAANAPRPQHVPTTNWYFIAGSFDATAGRVTLVQEPLTEFPFDATRSVVEQPTSVKALTTNAAPLLIAAAGETDATGHASVGGHFN